MPRAPLVRYGDHAEEVRRAVRVPQHADGQDREDEGPQPARSGATDACALCRPKSLDTLDTKDVTLATSDEQMVNNAVGVDKRGHTRDTRIAATASLPDLGPNNSPQARASAAISPSTTFAIRVWQCPTLIGNKLECNDPRIRSFPAVGTPTPAFPEPFLWFFASPL